MTITASQLASRFPALLAGIRAPDLELLLGQLGEQSRADGDVVITAGATSDALFLVSEGELSVEIEAPSGPVEVARIGAGEIAGEVSLLDPGRATASVRARGAVQLLCLRREVLDQLWRDEPQLASALESRIAAVLAARLREASDRVAPPDRSPTRARHALARLFGGK